MTKYPVKTDKRADLAAEVSMENSSADGGGTVAYSVSLSLCQCQLMGSTNYSCWSEDNWIKSIQSTWHGIVLEASSSCNNVTVGQG